MLRFSVCPHDTEGERFKRWEEFARKLHESVGEKVSFEPLLDFSEEKERMESGKFFDIYYANPFSSVELYRRGYKPIAKFKGQRDRYFLVYRDIPKEGAIKVSTALLRPVGLILLQLDIERVEVELCESWQRALAYLEEGKVHACIMYEEIWENVQKERRKNLKVMDTFVFESSHIFMVKPEVEERLKEFFKGDDFEPAEHILEKLLKAYENFDHIYKLWTKVKAFYILENSRGVGSILYSEKGIVFANDYALKTLEYKEEELTKMSLEEAINHIIHPSYRDKVFEIVQRRIKGEQFIHDYNELIYLNKRGKYIHTYTYSITVPYGEKSYGGLVLFIDITERKKFESLYRTLREVNIAITTSLFEEELFDKTCKSLMEHLDLKFIALIKEEGDPVLYKAYGLEDELKERFMGKYKVIGKEEIYIEPEVRENKEHSWLLDFGVYSFCSIPIRGPEGKLYLLNLYSQEPYYFDEREVRGILREFRHDLEFALNRIYDWRKAFIIKNALDRSSAWLVVTDEKGVITYVNEAVSRISGYSREELLGRKTNIFKSGFHDKEFYEELWKTIKSGKEFHAVFVNRKKNGETFYLEQHIYPLELPGRITRYVSIGKDITREIELSEEVSRLAFTDPMTGLLNKEGFESMVGEGLKQASKESFAFVILDLYGTGNINRNFGISAGDKYVQAFGELLKSEFKDAKFISRLYGDKFGMLIPIRMEEDVYILEERLLRLMDKYVDIGEPIPISINAGISLYPRDGDSFGKLYSKAKSSLKRAKEFGEGRIVVTDENIEKRIQDFTFAMKLVKNAVENELFVLYFQPYFEADTLEAVGAECLVRIADKDGKVYTPAYFIDYLEKSRYLRSFEGWLIREAIKSAGKLGLKLSINLSASTLKEAEFVKTLLAMPQLPLVIEITERVILELGSEMLELLETLRRERGVKIAMDDFGTGYSTLSQLTQLPVDILKIDMSFVKNMINNKRIRAIVRNTIALARDLGIATLAEGIETEPQLRMLQGMGCDFVQGYLFAKPMNMEDMVRFLEERRNKLAGALR
ncbi:EAL domain-containing protein [Hydrogenobacter sp. T-2]|uniref:EAL domain-containing protein n=1 Tax=Pampinifervens diazotrophicum TaxID=1632018 RepID=UPI002B25A27C|nr:EAL domain-containing protein [Hydrogenobacter sp. T-2]WPM31707.1 EAL domain-containing protein [Hydrogenobacter sp. T-2]